MGRHLLPGDGEHVPFREGGRSTKEVREEEKDFLQVKSPKVHVRWCGYGNNKFGAGEPVASEVDQTMPDLRSYLSRPTRTRV